MPRPISGKLRTALAFVICVLIATALELCVFNFDWATSLTSGEPVTISPTDANCVQSAKNGTLTINNVNTKVHSLRITFTGEGHNVAVSAMDESMSCYRSVGTIDTSGEPLYFHQEGNTLSIRLDTEGTPSEEFATITLNGVTPIDFQVVRWGLIALLLFAFWLVRPRSDWWEQRALEHKKAFPVCTCVMCAIALATLVVNLGNAPTDLNDIRNLYQYNDLARALASGHVYLDFQPSEGLLALSNPYDMIARESVDYLWDFALFNGKYYSYFGVIPCVVFYLPYYLATGNALPNLVVVMAALVAFYAGSVYLIRRAIGRWFPQASVATLVLCCVVFLFGTMSLSLVCLPTIYPVPIACGAACAVWGLALWMRACEGESFLWGRALWGTLLGALTLGCRPQFFLVFLLILPLFILPLFIDAVREKRVKAVAFFPLIIPIIVVGVLLCAYNYARFGSPFDFGSSYNLTNDDMSKHSVTAYMGALGIFGFLLQPAQVVADWPFVVGTSLSYAQNSDLVLEETMGGIFAVVPLTLAAFWFFWNRRLRQPWLLLALSIIGVVCAFLLAVFDACAGGLILRYQVDMGFFIAVAACIGILLATTKLLPTNAPAPEDETELASASPGPTANSAAKPSANPSAKPTADPSASTNDNADDHLNTGLNAGLAYALKLALMVATCISIALPALYFLGIE